MNKFICFVSMVLVLVSGASCSSVPQKEAATAECDSAQKAMQIGCSMLEAFGKGNYEEFARQLPAGLKKEFTSDAFDTGVKQITDSAGKMVKFRYLGALNGPVFTNYLWAVEFLRDSKSSGKVVQELLFKLTIAKADNSFQVTSFGFML